MSPEAHPDFRNSITVQVGVFKFLQNVQIREPKEQVTNGPALHFNFSLSRPTIIVKMVLVMCLCPLKEHDQHVSVLVKMSKVLCRKGIHEHQAELANSGGCFVIPIIEVTKLFATGKLGEKLVPVPRIAAKAFHIDALTSMTEIQRRILKDIER